jgi:hypothetical protein
MWQLQIGVRELSSLKDTRSAALQAVANGELETYLGYYFLPGRQVIVRQWLRRHTLAQEKWKLTRRAARWLQSVPFVNMLAMSGSLAAGNTRASSDLDLFVVAKAGRLWLARCGLLAVAELLGRRRRHWDQQAPDKLCLNHYVTHESLAVAPDIRNLYTAIAYQVHIPLLGDVWRQRFLAANEAWMQEYVATPAAVPLITRHALPESGVRQAVRGALEHLLAEPIWDWAERFAEIVQRWIITRHTEPGRAGRVVINNEELAFHPDTKVPALLAKYYH